MTRVLDRVPHEAAGVAAVAALVAVAVGELGDGAWLVVIPLLAAGLWRARSRAPTAVCEPLRSPIVIVAVGEWSHGARGSLAVAAGLSDDVYVLQIDGDGPPPPPDRAGGPTLAVPSSSQRRFLVPLRRFVNELEMLHPDRDIAVIVPEVLGRWYAWIWNHSHGRMRCAPLLTDGAGQLVIVTTPAA